MHYLSHELSQCGDDQARSGRGLPQPEPEVRRRLQPGVPQRPGRHGGAPRSDGFRPLCYRPGRPAVRRRQRERGPVEPRLRARSARCEPGEMILIQDGKIRQERFAPKQTPSHCFFEWIYFANVASTLDERSVYLTRAALGEELARQEQQLGRGAARRATRSWCRCPTPARPPPTPWPSSWVALRRGADPQSLHRPDVHRRAEPGDRVQLKYTPLREVLAGQARAAGSRTRSSAARR